MRKKHLFSIACGFLCAGPAFAADPPLTNGGVVVFPAQTTAKHYRHWPYVAFEVEALAPKDDSLAYLAQEDPGLAADLVLFSTTGFTAETKAAPPTATESKPASSLQTIVTVNSAGATVKTTQAAPAATQTVHTQQVAQQVPTGMCKASGLRTGVQAPATLTQAIVDIGSNSVDECAQQHKLELAKAFIARSNALCSIYVSSLDGSQRGYKTAFSVSATIFGAIGSLVSPAKVFSGLAGLSSGISGNLDTGLFYGEAGYLLATAIMSSQAEEQAKLYSRLGISQNTAAPATATNNVASPSDATTGVVVTLNPAIAAMPAKPAVAAKAGHPAIPATPAKAASPATASISMIAAASKSSSSDSSAATSMQDADLIQASLGHIYTEVNYYHSGCSVRVGLNQLQDKLNAPTPVKGSNAGGSTNANGTPSSATK